MKFLDVKTDLAFKKVFASEGSKDILISFLNALLYKDKDKYITDLTVVDPYTIPLIKGMKDTFVDVKAILNNGTKVIIEMQVLNHESFEQRILYNAAKNFAIQLGKGEDYRLLNPVIALTIVDFVMFEAHPEVISHFKMIEKDSLIKYSDDIELVFVELPKFKTSFEELDTDDIRMQWIYFLKNAGTMNIIPETFSEPLGKALSLIDESSISEVELEAQYNRKQFIYIQKNSLIFARKQGLEEGREQGVEQGLEEGREQGLEEGREQGLEEGLEEGREQGLEQGLEKGEDKRNVEVIQNMKKAGFNLQQSSLATGLTEEQVKKIVDSTESP
ncbi:MAG: Rpn family recombination-promoting nuclease/putative transposase [Thiotrichaceae bacterium]|nr:Rpn family recombination-promoting nuclease/putative transposase [Thiotrichaceae bacterium]